jgi:hypothetical protein
MNGNPAPSRQPGQQGRFPGPRQRVQQNHPQSGAKARNQTIGRVNELFAILSFFHQLDIHHTKVKEESLP